MKTITLRERRDLPADGMTDSELLYDCERAIDYCIEQIKDEHGSSAVLFVGHPLRETVDSFLGDRQSYVEVTRAIGVLDSVCLGAAR